jgi:hypothetical protein
MDTIKCPVCGEVNPADNEFCQNCQSRLEPLTGPLRGENAPLKPGQIPTKKTTSELEPILPQWLREVRQQSRQTDDQEIKPPAQESSPTVPIPSKHDLLAGLASQNDEDEDVPDWLADITGNAPAQKKKTEPDDSNIKRVELGNFTNTPADAAKNTAASTPTWMRPQEAAPEKDELANWLSQAGQTSASFADEKAAPVSPAQSAPASGSNDDWLHNLQTDSTFNESAPDQSSAPAYDTPDWLKNLDAAAAIPSEPSTPSAPSTPSLDADTPDWLKNLDAGNVASSAPAAASAPLSSDNDTPDWLKNLDAGNVFSPTPAASSPANDDSSDDWMKNLGANPVFSEPPASQQQANHEEPESTSSVNVPDWLRTFGDEAPASAKPVEESPAAQELPSDAVMPDWLKAAAPSGNVPPAIRSEPSTAGMSSSVEMPDWLASLKPVEAKPQEQSAPVFSTEEPAESESPASAPAFSSDDVDAIFGSIQMPDWLSSATASEQQSVADNLPPAAQSSDSIAPAELPSWVQAMRPVESVLSEAGTGAPSGSGVEEAGPLAGLEGVLPTFPGGFKPSSRTKSHPIKLNASEEQQSHSALLEKILAEETSPAPMKSPSPILSQRVLRWVVTVLLLLAVGGAFFMRSQIFSLPGRIPNDEAETAITALDTIPAGAPVLVVFDYEPSLAGELEATASPLLNRLLLLKHPNLIFVSTSPTGPALADRLMSPMFKERQYQFGVDYINFGYLPGGLAGVYDFAQNPTMMITSGGDSTALAQAYVLKGATHLSDFAAVIVLTDSAEAGRTWIEQAGQFRGNASLLVISSAQAAPMLMPYYQSKQINGLVSGLNSASKVEQANGQPGFVRRYWDAYSIGLLLAVVVITLGGLWNFVLGLQARRAKEAK